MVKHLPDLSENLHALDPYQELRVSSQILLMAHFFKGQEGKESELELAKPIVGFSLLLT